MTGRCAGWGGREGCCDGEHPSKALSIAVLQQRLPQRGQKGGDVAGGGEGGHVLSRGSCHSPVNCAGSGADATCLHEDVLLMRNVLLTARNCSDSAEIFQAF